MDERWIEEAYRSYAATLGWKLANGQLMPSWQALPEEQRQAWAAAMETAREWMEEAFLEGRTQAWIEQVVPEGPLSNPRWN